MKSWVFSSIGYIALAILVLFTSLLNPALVDRTQLFAWTATLTAIGLLWRLVPPRWMSAPAFPYLAVIGAAVASGWLIRFSGRWMSPYLTLSLLVPLTAVFYGPSWPAALMSGAATSLSLIVTSGWPPPQLGTAITQIMLLWLAAIGSALTAAQSAERQRVLEKLRHITLAASATIDLEQLLSDVLQVLGGAAQASSACMLIHEKVLERDYLVCQAAVGPAANVEIPLISLGQGLTGRAAESGQVIYQPDVRQDSDYMVLVPDTRSELALPLKLGDRVVGVINLENHRPRAFGRRDRQLLAALMPPIALAVNSALLAERVAEVSCILSATAEEMFTLAASVSMGLSEVTQAMGDMARSVEIQAEQAEEIHRAVAEMVQATNQIAARAEETAAATRQTTTTAAESTAMLQTVGERAMEVSQMVNLVQKLAHQTHLLALNAAIEAARAGEQGRGFTVVADEIRRLANRSRDSATDIAEQNERMEEAVSRLVEATARVSDKMSQTERLVADISQASQHQDRQMLDINEAVSEAVAAAEQNAAITEQVTSAAETQTAAMREVQSSAAKLATLAAQLDDLVSQMHQTPTDDLHTPTHPDVITSTKG